MGLQENVYSVLVVSSVENFNTAMSSMLPESTYSPIVHASNVAAARRKFAERQFDFVIINAPLSDDLGVRFAIDCSGTNGAIVLLLVRNEIHSEIYDKVSAHGVFTLPKPMSQQAMRTALRWAETAKQLTKRFDNKATSVEDKMAQIRLVNKAKWLLISNENMTEPEAHRFIEKEAMNRCITKKAIAEEIIAKYSEE